MSDNAAARDTGGLLRNRGGLGDQRAGHAARLQRTVRVIDPVGKRLTCVAQLHAGRGLGHHLR